MTEEAMKKWIDQASYEDLLRKWRFSSVGDPFFQGEIGKYYSDIMFEKKAKIGFVSAAAISKRIGWDRP